MRKKLVILMMMSLLTMGLVACGSEKDTTNTSAESNNVNVESNAQENNIDVSITEPTTDAETQDVEADKAPAISTVKEEEAIIDFDGVKLPMAISWEEFKQFMADNNWTFEDDEEDFPGGDKPLKGRGYVNTNCGKVYFSFRENADETQAVLVDVEIYAVNCPATISIAGININTSADELSKVLTPVENAPNRFYLDTYLTVQVDDAGMFISRTYFHMR